MSHSSQPNPALSKSPEAVLSETLMLAAKRNPDLEHALLWSAVPRWFDAEVVKGMFPPDKPPAISTDEIVQYLRTSPFSEPHPTRDDSWRFREEYRERLLKQEAITQHQAELHARAADLFKKRFDAKAPVGEKKFEDRGLKDLAVEYVYHLQQLDTAKALKAVRGICAESLAVLTSALGRPEVVFCSRFIGALDWPTVSEEVEQELSFLRTGITALLTKNDVKALPMLYELVEFPELNANQRSNLHNWIGEIHLWEEERLGPALDHFRLSEQLTPTDAIVHVRISEVHYRPGRMLGRFDLAEQHARRALELVPAGKSGYVSIAGFFALGEIAKLQENVDEALTWYDEVIKGDPSTLVGYLSESEIYSEKGELNRALETLDDAVSASPDSEYYVSVRRGDAYRDARRYDEAFQEYSRATDKAPERIDAYISTGEVRAMLWQLEAAEKSYRKAIELKPDASSGYVSLARLYEQQSKWERAIGVCLEAKKRIVSKDLFFRLSDSYERQGRLEDLRKVQEELVKLDPAEEYASHCSLGDAWLAKAWQRGNDQLREQWLSEAQDEFNKALARDPYRAWAHLSLAKLAVLKNDELTIQEQKRWVSELIGWAHYDMLVSLGRAYLDNYQYLEAEQELRDAVELAPRRKAGWLTLSDLYYQKSDVAGVERAWSQLVNINPGLNYDKHMRVGDAYYRDANYEQAREEYTQARDLEPETYEAYWALADIAEIEGDLEKALANHEMVATTAPGLAPIANVRMAKILITKESFEDAEARIQDAIRLDREQPLAYIELARLGVIKQREELVTQSRQLLASAAADKLCDFDNAIADEYRQAKQYDKADQAYRESIRQSPERAEAYIGLGQVRLDQDQPERATEYLPQALIIDRTNFDAYMAVAEMYEKLGQLDDAEKALNFAIRTWPWEPYAYLNLGLLLRKRGRSEEERKAYKEAKEAAGVGLLELGASYELKRKLDDAIEVYRSGLDYEPAELQPDFHLALASLYARTNNLEQAMEEYRQAIDLDPARPEAYEGWAQLLEEKNEIEEALRVFEQMAQQPELAYLAQISSGNLLEDHDQYEEAMRAYRQALALDPKGEEAYVSLAELLKREDRVNEAVEVYGLMAKQPELTYNAELYSGNLLAEQGRYDDAVKAYRQAIEANPAVAAAYTQLGNLYHLRANLKEAEEILHEGSKAAPDDPELPFRLAQLKEEQARSDEAIRLFRKAVELDPDGNLVSEARRHIGRLLFESKQYKEAEMEFMQAIISDPANAEAYYDLGFLLEQQEQAISALEWYSKATKIQRKFRDAYVGSLRIYASQKDTKNLALLARQILDLHLDQSERYDALLVIGEAYLIAEAIDEAATTYRQALELDPKATAAYVRLAQLLADENRIDEALEVCRRMAQQPQLAYLAQMSIGNLLVAQEKYSEAEQSYQQAIEANPKEEDAYLRLAVLHYQAGRLDETERLLSKSIEIAPDKVEPLRLIAEFREQQGRWDEAIAFYRRALELKPSGIPAAESYQRIATILTEQNRYAEAEKELQHARENDPDNPGIYYQLGIVYELLGTVERAAENYTKVTELDPKNVNAYRALGYLYAELADSKKLTELAQHILRLDLQPDERYQAHVLISKFYQTAKLYEPAIKYLNQAILLDPKRFDAYSALAQIYEIQQDWSKAQGQYEKVAELEPEYQIDMRLRIGHLFVVQQNPEAAEKEFSKIKGEELKPDDRRIELLTASYLDVASLYRKQSKLDAMRRVSGEVISLVTKLQPTSNNAFRQVGLAHLMRGESAEAAQVLNRVLKAEPADAKARFYFALNALLEGDAEKAQSELKLAIEKMQHEDDYIYAIEEAEMLAARVPEVVGAREMLRTLRDIKLETAKQ